MKKITRISSWLGMSLFVLLIGHSAAFAQKTYPAIEKAIKSEEYGKALSLINDGLASSPKEDALFYLRGKVYFEQGSMAEAKAAFKKGIGYGGRNPWNYIGLGGVLATENNFEEAKTNLTKVLEELNKKNETAIIVGVSNAYLNSQDGRFLDEAERLLLKVLSMEPKNVNAMLSLGDMYYQRKIYELAQMKYLEGLGVDNNCMDCYLRVGKIKIQDKEYNEGADFFMKALKIDPNFGPAYGEMGELWYKAGEMEKAKENYKKYVELTGGDLTAKVRYGGILYLTGDFQGSIDVLKPLTADTITPAMMRVIAYDYIDLKDAAKGREYLDKYFKLMKDGNKEKYILSSDYEYEGKLLQLEDKKNLAVDAYMKVAEMDEERKDIYKTISNLYAEDKNDSLAASYLRKFVDEGDPKFKDWFDLGNMYYKRKDYENSDTIFASIAEKYTTTHIGNIFRARGKAQQDPTSEEGLAKPCYELVHTFLMAKEDPNARELKDLKEASQYLGYYYYKHGEDCENALPYWEKVLELEPENEGAQQIIDYCKNK